MNKKILTYAILPMLGLTLLTTGIVSAHGWFGRFADLPPPEEIVEHQQTIFEHKADLLGISVDKVKDYWAEGKNLMEMAEAEGITQEDLQARMQEARMQQMQEMLQSLVDNGVISHEQADKRLQFMQNNQENMKFSRHFHHGGFGW